MCTDCSQSGLSEAKREWVHINVRAKSVHKHIHMLALIYYLDPTPLVVPAVNRFCKWSRKTLFAFCAPKVRKEGLTELGLNSL